MVLVIAHTLMVFHISCRYMYLYVNVRDKFGRLHSRLTTGAHLGNGSAKEDVDLICVVFGFHMKKIFIDYMCNYNEFFKKLEFQSR